MGKELILYLSVSPTTVSATFIKEEDKVQKLVYYVSKVLIGAETRYLKIERLTYALMIAARKLQHYFQANPIVILTNRPLKQTLHRPDTSGRLLKWSIELSKFHINYQLRIAIKAQSILADFIAEFTYDVALSPDIKALEEQNQDNDLTRWKLFVDGSANQHGCGIGIAFQTPSGEQMEYAIRIRFKATNNNAEYEALLARLRIATELGLESLDAYSDFQHVINQVQGDYLTKNIRMLAYLDEVKAMSTKIREFKIRQIPREENKKADALANLASAFDFISDRSIPLEFFPNPSTDNTKIVYQVATEPTWMDDIIAYLKDGKYH
ncbi:hypothetical protein Acr_21g0002460 [Actinidia rufa]|uniref:RNase H type-1 domain-containing protein n=1 Tax=Actinidia rufa TaxID=165716 RepID=A0A7J0GFQ2_9ERIC|nr:hypothetical protein Acr_21g0002460 [Actinidia rufa]